ncbi:17949_t:CDS:2 [Funneliformis geosporum]|nr:17949_t:CDS:2 [Funneliformis geosporum]
MPQFDTSSVLANASKGTPKITSFWGSAGDSFVLSKFSAPNICYHLHYLIFVENLMLCERIVQLQDDLIKNGKMLMAFEYNRQHAVYEYLIQINDDNEKMKATKFYLNHQSFPVSYRGKHHKYHRLVDDEDIALSLQQWL